VGVFGGLNNVGYNLAKILRKRGADVELIQNPHENFAFSQPLWDDCEVVLDAEALRDGTMSQRFWAKKAIEVGWKRPEWVRQVNGRGREVAVRKPGLALRAIVHAGMYTGAAKFALGSLHLVGPLSDFDFLVLLGTGPVFGSLAGVPYVGIPCGSDITLEPFQNSLLAHMLRRGYARAHRILIGDWRFVEPLAKLNLSGNWTYFPIPIDPESYADVATLDRSTASKLWPHSSTRGKFVFLMPGAHAFNRKGTDRAMQAFLRLSGERNDIVLVTTDWGEDTAQARQMVVDAGKEEKVVFLPYVVSRPLLRAFYRASNVVLEEFVCGSYGSSTLEAMACERAVIQHIDLDGYRPYLRRLPPVLQARTEDEIYDRMKWAVENPDALTAVARESREWIADEHSLRSASVLEEVMSKLA
jgi:glycosyltransferase involved in cell wall biosynthesis